MDGPGETKPDWEIFSMIGQEMGAAAIDWGSAEKIAADHESHTHLGVFEQDRFPGDLHMMMSIA